MSEQVKRMQELAGIENSKVWFVVEKAKSSLLKDLKGNNIKHEHVEGNRYRIEDTPKGKMAIQMVKERFGTNSIVERK